MTKRPKVSICIPTYNRSEYLSYSLDALVKAVEGYEDQIEIVINDNASDDETGAVMKAFENKFKNVVLGRNKTNEGPLPNLYKVIEMARGEFVWLFGDDDMILPNAIAKVMAVLNAGADYVICNCEFFDQSMTVRRKRRYFRGASGEIRSPGLLLKRHGLKIGCISALVIPRERFLHVPREEFFNRTTTGFAHLYPFLVSIRELDRGQFVSKPLFRYRTGNSEIVDWEKFFVSGAASVFDDLVEAGYSQELVRAARCRTVLDFIVKNIALRKANSLDNEAIYNSLKIYYRDCIAYWIICLPIKFVPDTIFKTLMIASRLARGVLWKLRFKVLQD